MDRWTLIAIFACLIPLVTALVGGIIETAALRDSVTPRERYAKRMLLIYFTAVVFVWCGAAVHAAGLSVSLTSAILAVFSIMAAPVLVYRFTGFLIPSDDRRLPSRWHFIFPVIYGLIYLAVTCPVPHPLRIALAAGDAGAAAAYPLYTFVYLATPFVQSGFNLFYMWLTMRKARRWYDEHKADRAARRWFMLYGLLTVLSTVWSVSLCPFAYGTALPLVLPLAVAASWLQVVILIGLTFERVSLLLYPLGGHPKLPRMPRPEITVEKESPAPKRQSQQAIETEHIPLTKRNFERYVVREKLFLNPKLKMTDLQETFHTNRTYLSNFVNRTYGVNFSCYINRLRLGELRRLQNLPSNAGKPATRLYAQAGFTSYRTYLYINKEVEEQAEAREPDKTAEP